MPRDADVAHALVRAASRLVSTRPLMTLFTPILLSSAFAQCPPGEAMASGAAAYKAARYTEAAACFSDAARADPKSVEARLYLGYSYLSQFKPGDRSPANENIGLTARQRFVDVLDLDPKNIDAMASVAMLSYQQQNFSDARLWYGKLSDADPKNKEAAYMLGVIAYAESNILIAQARDDLGMKPDDPGPLKDVAKRTEIRSQDWDRLQQGMQSLNKALSLDPDYDDAMSYLSLLYRQRADLQGDVSYKTDISTAESWQKKALDAKKRKGAR